MWSHTGQGRPGFAVEPQPGQESVWDYPRPPALKPDGRVVEVRNAETMVAETTRSYRILETASPPTFYLPMDDVKMDELAEVPGGSVCEWKGAARYWALASEPGELIAWEYPRPRARFRAIRDHIAFYPGRIGCFVDGERVQPQPGRFYGGWVTSDIVGPFKGEPGTGHW